MARLLSSFAKIVNKLKYTDLKQISQVVKEVDQYSKIKIRCKYDLEIKPYDLLDCPSSNRLRATIFNKFDIEMIPYDVRDEPDSEILKIRQDTFKDEQEIVDNFEISVKQDLIHISGGSESDLKCILEVPIKADLNIENLGSTSIKDMYSDNLDIISEGNIELKSVKGTSVNLKSINGNITTKGTLLAQAVKAVTENDGNVTIDKLQGENVEIITKHGSISTNSSYSTDISFKTENGHLNLKNVHRNCEIFTTGPGDLKMTGFSGTIKANVMSKNIKLQISDLLSQSQIIAKNEDVTMELNLDEHVLQNAQICIKNAKNVEATGDIPKVNDGYGSENAENRLNIDTKGSVMVKKLSWADVFAKIK